MPMRQTAALFLFLLVVASLEPFARASLDISSCCCVGDASQCPARGETCTWQSRCPSDRQAVIDSRPVYLAPAETAHPPELLFAALDREIRVSTLARKVPVPDPPPRG